jgi:hypothetical protein
MSRERALDVGRLEAGCGKPRVVMMSPASRCEARRLAASAIQEWAGVKIFRRLALSSWLCTHPLGVRLPKAKLNAPRTAPERVEHHRAPAIVHRDVSIPSADGIERAINIVDTIINANPVAIFDPIFGHGLICLRTID